MDDELIIPSGCLECGSIVAIATNEGLCPYCSSSKVHRMEEIIGLAMEQDRISNMLGLDNYEDYEE